MQNMTAGPNGCARGGGGGGLRRHVLKFECHHGNGAGEFANGIQVLVRSVDLEVRHLSRRSVFVRRKRVNAIAHAPRRDREHTAQLSAPQYAHCAAGQNWLTRTVTAHSTGPAIPTRFVRAATSRAASGSPGTCCPECRRQQRRIRCAGISNRQRSDRDTCRHLNNRKQ